MADRDIEDDDKPLELPIGGRPPKKGRKPGTKSGKQQQTSENNLQSNLKGRPRDPRFDPRVSGSADPRHFIRNYSFLDEVKARELGELQTALKREKDPEKRDKIKMTITRYRNKMLAKQQKLQNKKRGKHKKVELVEKFKDLKESGKLTKYLERKRKKLLKRDQKSFG